MKTRYSNGSLNRCNSRSRGRYHAYREAQVARGDKPDMIVASAAAQCEVAIEVKHGGKGWTATQLEQALRNQLAVNYLKPATRRHGILVITHHRDRQWLDPLTRKPMSFDAVIGWLSNIAATLVETDSGAIEVKCTGINAWRDTFPTSREQKKSPAKKPAQEAKPSRPATEISSPCLSSRSRATGPSQPLDASWAGRFQPSCVRATKAHGSQANGKAHSTPPNTKAFTMEWPYRDTVLRSVAGRAIPDPTSRRRAARWPRLKRASRSTQVAPADSGHRGSPGRAICWSGHGRKARFTRRTMKRSATSCAVSWRAKSSPTPASGTKPASFRARCMPGPPGSGSWGWAFPKNMAALPPTSS